MINKLNILKAAETLKLTDNFTWDELLYAQMPLYTRQLNLKYLMYNDSKHIFINYKRVAEKFELIRRNINFQFPKYKGMLGIIVTSGFRCYEVEIFKGRDGSSRHSLDGVDFMPVYIGDDPDLIRDFATRDRRLICLHILENLKKHMGGLAFKKVNGRFRFIHIDLREPKPHHIERGYGARWKYG